MSLPVIKKKRANEILNAARERRVVVLGDVMLDEFIWGDVSRISPEAPVPVVDVKRESTHLGGAANVLANLLSLGANGCVVGIIGNDYAADRIRLSLKEKSSGQRDEFLIAAEGRPTTIKTRIIAQHQMVVRADRENRTPVNGENRAAHHFQCAGSTGECARTRSVGLRQGSNHPPRTRSCFAGGLPAHACFDRS
jgi:D-beta-D-heptose 7-phosphate kinase/D-beta-D-heptose 1-phosphate adenosyltransferase